MRIAHLLRNALEPRSAPSRKNCARYFASVRVDNLRTYLKIHSGENSNKCDQCDFVSVQASKIKHPKGQLGSPSVTKNHCMYFLWIWTPVHKCGAGATSIWIPAGQDRISNFKWLGAALNLVEIKNPFGSVQTDPQADAWWVPLFIFLKKSFF